jgi:murein DD-endopeptidase MepM/ murein hydrolase activator NlpD
MGGENFGVGDTDWEFPTVELGFGDPGYTPLIGSQVEKRPDGNWYYPGNPFPVRPNVSRFAEKRLKDLDIVKSKDLGSQKFPDTRAPDLSKTNEPDSKGKTAVPSIAPKPKDKLPTKPGQFSLEKNDTSPIPDSVVTDEFGSARKNRKHQGIDMRAPVGTPILAPNNGRVLQKGFDDARGGFIILGDSQGNQTHQFMHLSKILVKNGDVVSQGQEIAKSGNTGHSRSPHLHWEKWMNGEPVDPANFVRLSKKSDS